MAVSMIGPKFYAWDRNGKPLAFGKLYTYQARTNIPKPTYQSEDQVVENTNPVILNGEGYANVYLDGSYKMVLKDEKDNEIWSSDPVTSASAEEWVNCFTANYVSSTSFKVSGNQTNEYRSERKVRIDNNTSEYAYADILSSTYASGETSVVINKPVVTTGILTTCTSIVSGESSFSGQDVGGLTNYQAASVDDMIAGITIGGEIITHVAGQVWVWAGYYSPNDGGGNCGIIRTGAHVADGGSIFSINESTYVEANLKGSKVPIRKFGATPSDSSSSSSSIQAAINYVGSLQNGGVVWVGAGRFLVDVKLSVTNRLVSIKGNKSSSTLKAASGLDYIIHQQAPGSGSYINRYLDGVDVSGLTLEGADGEHVTVGIFCNGTYNSQYKDLRWLNLDSCVDLDGTIKCLFDSWQDGDREPSGVNKPNYLVRSIVSDPTTERDNTFSKIVMHAKTRHMTFPNGSDGVNILNNILFVNNTELEVSIYIYKGLYGNITGNKLFESRGEGIVVDSCAHIIIDSNIIPLSGQSRQAAAISAINTANIAGHGQELTITNNSINQPSGNGIEIYGYRSFSVSNNTVLWAGYQGRFSGQEWGSANSIVIGDGCIGGTIKDNQTSFKLYADKAEYSRTSYDILLESGSFGNIVSGHLPYYVEDKGVDNLVKNRDGDTNRTAKVFDETARNMIRQATSDMSGWMLGNVSGVNPSVTYNSAGKTPTGRTTGVSSVTFPDTYTSESYVQAQVGTAGLNVLPTLNIGDDFIFSVFMKSNSHSMRKVTLSLQDQSGEWDTNQVFNVGVEWKRYWMVAKWTGIGENQLYCRIKQQQTFSGTILLYGAKVEIVSGYYKRAEPSPYDHCKIRYSSVPSSGNGGDVQQGDEFFPLMPTDLTPYVKVATASGANNFTLKDVS